MQIKTFRKNSRRVHFSSTKRYPQHTIASQPPPNMDDLTYSTPRSELNNPIEEPQALLDANKSTKDAPTRRKTPASSAQLKRADPKDLPSYPSRGVSDLGLSAGRAAVLAASNSKSPELWKPDPIPAAGTAANLAKSVKSPEPWKSGPLPNAATAALLAGDVPKVPQAWQPSSSASASKAASLVKDRKPAETKRSPPQTTPNALAAAGMANKSPKKVATKPASTQTPAYDINKINARASQNAQTTLASASQPRSLPSQSQTDKNMSDILRAAKTSMAKTSKSPPTRPISTLASSSTPSMPPNSYYSHIPTSPPKPSLEPSTEKTLNRQSSMAAASVAAYSDAFTHESVEEQSHRTPKYYPHLEEAARKAASERLARLQAEHDRARKASGLPPSWQPSGPHTRSITSPAQQEQQRQTRARATSAAKSAVAAGVPASAPKKKSEAADFARSMKIKSDTAKLGRQMDSVDKDRQARDYLALMAAAEKNVKSRMEALETKVAEDQGRVPKHLQAQWDAKARMLSEESERKRAAEQEKKKGKIDMGGGLWYDQEDLERLAKGNVQPILDEINVKAEKERARLEALRVEKETQEREKKEAAAAVAGVKAEAKKAKALEKAAAKSRRDAEKAEERQRRAEFKEAQRQEKERQKNEKLAQRQVAAAAAIPIPITPEREEAPAVYAEPEAPAQEEEMTRDIEGENLLAEPGMEHIEPRPMSQAGHDRVDREREMHEAAKKEKGWFGSLQKRLTRRMPGVKKDKDAITDGAAGHAQEGQDEEDDDDVSSISSPSVRDVALAGAQSLSGVSSSDEEEAEIHTAAVGVVVDAHAVTGQYAADDSDSSSTSSGDLYTTSPRYNPLTSATYNPGMEGEELVMQAFIESPDELRRRRYSTSTESSSDIEEQQQGVVEEGEKTFGEIVPDAGEGGVMLANNNEEAENVEPGIEKHTTFGGTLAEKVKKSFEEYSRDEIGKEEEKEKEEGRAMNLPAIQTGVVKTDVPEITEVPPTPKLAHAEEKEEEDKDVFHQARDDFSDVSNVSKDGKREKRSSRFSEILE
ncbi:hypothetical protein TWF694_003362 [Orbilia ellipsospora]|uniref:Eisosome protein 1 protein n=1 Tax=Orbilia ellipsospora TaxID=2528407 RepID=A0AAV9X039_9PEZI